MKEHRSDGRRLSGRRRLLVPEVVQTSAMDCGPAALKCLLEGFGIPVSYGRLREACQTDVDGTSIDTLEEVARQLRLDAVQVMLPVDHLLLPEAEALPALVVVTLPSGFTHFIVLWRRHGPWVQVMDPDRDGAGSAARSFCETSMSTNCGSPPRTGLPGPGRTHSLHRWPGAWRTWA